MHWRNNHLLILLRNRSDTAKIFVGIFSTETIVFGRAPITTKQFVEDNKGAFS